MLAGTRGCMLVANMTNKGQARSLMTGLSASYSFSVAGSSHLSEWCVLMALAADWSGVPWEEVEEQQPHGGGARELQVIGLWLPSHQEGGRGPFVTIPILWCVREDLCPALCH